MIKFKVFRYSFFGTIPNFLNRLLDSPFLVGFGLNFSVVYILWKSIFPWQRKQKTSKTLKLKFSAIQISLWKANTNILNCGVWHTKYKKNKTILYVCFEVNRKNISNFSFCIVIVNAPKNNQCFDEMAQKYFQNVSFTSYFTPRKICWNWCSWSRERIVFLRSFA